MRMLGILALELPAGEGSLPFGPGSAAASGMVVLNLHAVLVAELMRALVTHVRSAHQLVEQLLVGTLGARVLWQTALLEKP